MTCHGMPTEKPSNNITQSQTSVLWYNVPVEFAHTSSSKNLQDIYIYIYVYIYSCFNGEFYREPPWRYCDISGHILVGHSLTSSITLKWDEGVWNWGLPPLAIWMGNDGNVLSCSSGFALRFAYHFSERHIQIPWFLLDFWRVFSEDFLDLNRGLFGFDVRWLDPWIQGADGIIQHSEGALFYWTSPLWPLFFYSGSTPRFPYGSTLLTFIYIYLCKITLYHTLFLRIWGVKCRLQGDTRGPVEKMHNRPKVVWDGMG